MDRLFLVFCTLCFIKAALPAPVRCPIPIDLALIFDSSYSIGEENWGKVLNFAKTVVDNLDISENGTHIAVMIYSTNPKIMIKFNTYTGVDLNAVNIKRDISSLRLQKGLTFIDKALLLAEKELFTLKSGMRNGTQKVAFVLTDGIQTKNKGPYTSLRTASSGLKLKGVKVYSLGIGSTIDIFALTEMANTVDYVVSTANFEDLSTKVKEIIKVECQEPCPVPIDLALILQSSASVREEDWKSVLKFSKAVVDNFDISENGTHIAVMIFGTNPEIIIKFNTYTGVDLNAVNIKRDISSLRLQKGLTFIDKALSLAEKELFTVKSGMRNGILKLALVLTNGIQTKNKGPYTSLEVASSGLTEKGVKIYPLGIGNDIDVLELFLMASGPEYVFSAIKPEFLFPKVKKSIEAECQEACRIPIDLALILDSSARLGETNWRSVLNFSRSVVDNFDISENGNHIAVMIFSTNPEIKIKFNKYTGADLNAVNIKRDISSLRLQKGLKFIDKALLLAEKELFTVKSGMRNGALKVAVVLTDGIQTKNKGNYTSLEDASSGLREKGVEVYSLGVGKDIDVMDLAEISSSVEHMFSDTNFKNLISKIKETANAKCQVHQTLLDIAMPYLVGTFPSSRTSSYFGICDETTRCTSEHTISTP